MELGTDTIVDDLVDGIFVGVNRRYELSCLKLDHRGSRKNLSIKQQRFDQDLSVHRVGKPSGVDSRRLERISRLYVASASGEWVHHGDCQAASVVVYDFVRGYCRLGQSASQ